MVVFPMAPRCGVWAVDLGILSSRNEEYSHLGTVRGGPIQCGGPAPCICCSYRGRMHFADAATSVPLY